jgi:hypothetical protein
MHRHWEPQPVPQPTIIPVRYNHGHYVAIGRSQRNSARGKDSGAFTYPWGSGDYKNGGIPGGHTGSSGGRNRMTQGPAAPGVRGVYTRYYMKEIELAPGVYDWTGPDADLAQCKALGIQWILMIEDRTFDGAPSSNPVPDYLNKLPYVAQFQNGNVPGGGWQGSRWNPYFLSRKQAIIDAAGGRYDLDPNFEGVATQETSTGGMSPTTAVATGYNAATYLAALNSECNFPHSRLVRGRQFGFQNFISDTTNALGDAKCLAYMRSLCASGKGAVGGPDVLPDSFPLATRAYPRYRDPFVLGRGPLFLSAQHDSYAQTRRTAQDLFDFMTGQLVVSGNTVRCDYIFWDLQEGGGTALQFARDVMPIIAAHPDFHFFSETN